MMCDRCNKHIDKRGQYSYIVMGGMVLCDDCYLYLKKLEVEEFD